MEIGTFLSGGIDSSLVTALAQAASAAAVRTFTVGFGGQGQDETAPAAAVARHLGTDHTEIHLTPADALAAVDEVHRWWDEPFADPSQLPTALLCRQTRRHVTVALSGDGGDETFGGYRRYTAGGRISRWVLPLPGPVRRAGSGAVSTVPPGLWDRVRRVGHACCPGWSQATWPRRPTSWPVSLRADSAHLYVRLVSASDDAESVVLGGPIADWPGPPDLPWAGDAGDAADAMMGWDTLSTLPDEMLVKVDRASMAFGLEVRVPLLDHRVVQAAWALPPELRINAGTGKRALRLVLDRYVPPHLVTRPKTGFDPPLAEWLRGPLRPWADDLLSESRLRAQGLLDAAPVRARWDQLLAGRSGQDYAMWAVLMFQAWLDSQ